MNVVLARLSLLCVNAGLIGFTSQPSVATEPARVGEPYELLGKRLVFTNWIYVRPGDVGWRDKEGRGVSANESIEMGPFEAVWTPSDHMSWGIQLRAQEPAQIIPQWHPVPEYPWEQGSDIRFTSVVEDNGIYKAWGSCKAGACYFESKDAIHWERPKLGLVE